MARLVMAGRWIEATLLADLFAAVCASWLDAGRRPSVSNSAKAAAPPKAVAPAKIAAMRKPSPNHA